MSTSQNEIDAVLGELGGNVERRYYPDQDALRAAITLNRAKLPDTYARRHFLRDDQAHDESLKDDANYLVASFPPQVRELLGMDGLCFSVGWLLKQRCPFEDLSEWYLLLGRYPFKVGDPAAWPHVDPRPRDELPRAIEETRAILAELASDAATQHASDWLDHYLGFALPEHRGELWSEHMELEHTPESPADSNGYWVRFDIGWALDRLAMHANTPPESVERFRRVIEQYYPDEEMALPVIMGDGRKHWIYEFEWIDPAEVERLGDLNRSCRFEIPGTMDLRNYALGSRHSVDQLDILPFTGFVFLDPDWDEGWLRCVVSDGQRSYVGIYSELADEEEQAAA